MTQEQRIAELCNAIGEMEAALSKARDVLVSMRQERTPSITPLFMATLPKGWWFVSDLWQDGVPPCPCTEADFFIVTRIPPVSPLTVVLVPGRPREAIKEDKA